MNSLMEEIMNWMPMEWARHRADAKQPTIKIPAGLRIVGATLRAIFMACLLMITICVSMPQNETIWTADDTPGDLVRIILGFAVCLWIAVQLFRAPRDPQAYRTWTYLGLFVVPFALICLVSIW